jgi:malonate-semialdehyde dehydrogenase (acetylating)/methylmalonate-semialdehyde dehydrogenase
MYTTPEFITINHFIDGDWVADPSADQLPLYNPSTGDVIGQVPMATAELSRKAVESAYAAYDSWKKKSVGQRMGFLFDMRRAMENNIEELAYAIAIDQGKHISEARGEIQRVIQIIETACCIPTLIQGETLEGIAGNIVGRVTRSPLGVFCGVAPFNFPALVFGWFIPFAIGVGNTFVYKPSTQSPYFMQKMGEIFRQIGLPKGVINIIHGNRQVPETWYDDPRVAGVCLVGSTPTAKQIAMGCARGAKRSMLLGGAKNFLVAMEDLQMDVFIENFLHSCYGSAGQRCLAGSVVAVVPEIYDSVVQEIITASKSIVIGDALDPNVFMGPVISAGAKAKIEHYIDIGVKERSKLVLDGRNPAVPDKNRNGYFVGPTVFSEVTPCQTIAREEIFGPVVSIMPIKDLDDVLALIRAQDFGNGACIFTQNLYYAEKFISEADVGMVGVNVGICAPHPYLPFGGIKSSLIGTDKVQGKDGIDFFTQNKTATIRFSPPTGPYAGHESRHTVKPIVSGPVRSCVAG